MPKKPRNPLKTTEQRYSSRFLRNSARSLGFVTKDALTQIAPNLMSTVTTGTDLAREAFQLFGRNKSSLEKVNAAISNNKYAKAATEIYKNAMSDIKSGKFWNEDRGFGGGDDTDGGFSFGDEDTGDEGSLQASQEIVSSNQQISASLDNVGDQIQRNGLAQIKVMKASTDAMLAANSASIFQTQQIGTEINSHLTNIENQMAAIVEFQNNNMMKFIESSLGYYEKVGASYSDSNKTAEEKAVASNVIKNGGIDMAMYKKYIKSQFKDSSLGQILENSDMILDQMRANPIGTTMSLVTQFIIPKALSNTLKGLEKGFNKLSTEKLLALGDYGKNSTDNSLMGMIKRTIAQTFGIVPEKSKRDLSGRNVKIERGPIPFDGETKHAITQIITNELREQTSYIKIITEHLTKEGPASLKTKAEGKMTFWDWNTNSYITGKGDLNKSIANKLTDSIVSEFEKSDLGEALRNLVESQTNDDGSADEKAQKELKRVINEFYVKASRKDGEINANNLIDIIATQVGGKQNSRDALIDFIRRLDNENRDAISSSRLAVVGARGAYNKAIEELLSDPNILHSTFNNEILTGDRFDKFLDKLSFGAREEGGSKINTKNAATISDENKEIRDAFKNSTSAAAQYMNRLSNSLGLLKNGDVVGSITEQIKFLGDRAKVFLFGTKDQEGKHKNGIFSDLANEAHDFMFGDGSKREDAKNKAKSVFGGIKDTLKTGFLGWQEAFFGKKEVNGKLETDEEFKERINKEVSERLPNMEKGMFGGAIVGGLLGNPFLGAAVGGAMGLASRSDWFQDLLFGKEDENGERTIGGIINKRVRDWFKDNKKEIGKSATIGSIGGGLLGMVTGGPILGALLGGASGIISQTGTFKRFLYGDPENGQTGLIRGIVEAFNKNKKRSDEEIKKDFGKMAIGAGAGFLTASMISNMGILGAALTPFGPIGGAIAGLALTIKSQGTSIREYLFGKDVEEIDGKKFKGEAGVVSKLFSNVKVNFINPIMTEVKHGIGTFFNHLEHHFLSPIRFLTKFVAGKIGDGIGNITSTILNMSLAPFKLVGNLIGGLSIFGTPLSRIGGAIANAGMNILGAPGQGIKNIIKILDPSMAGEIEADDAMFATRRDARKDLLKNARRHDKNAKTINRLTKGRYNEDTSEAREYIKRTDPKNYYKYFEKGDQSKNTTLDQESNAHIGDDIKNWVESGSVPDGASLEERQLFYAAKMQKTMDLLFESVTGIKENQEEGQKDLEDKFDESNEEYEDDMNGGFFSRIFARAKKRHRDRTAIKEHRFFGLDRNESLLSKIFGAVGTGLEDARDVSGGLLGSGLGAVIHAPGNAIRGARNLFNRVRSGFGGRGPETNANIAPTEGPKLKPIAVKVVGIDVPKRELNEVGEAVANAETNAEVTDGKENKYDTDGKTAEELREEKAKLEEREENREFRKELLNKVGGLQTTEEEKKWDWRSIFSKKGLLTAGALLVLPLIAKALPWIIENAPKIIEGIKSAIDTVASTVGTIYNGLADWFGWPKIGDGNGNSGTDGKDGKDGKNGKNGKNIIGNIIGAEIIGAVSGVQNILHQMDFTAKNKALTDGNNIIEQVSDKLGSDNLYSIMDSKTGDIDNTSTAKANLLAQVGKDVVFSRGRLPFESKYTKGIKNTANIIKNVGANLGSSIKYTINPAEYLLQSKASNGMDLLVQRYIDQGASREVAEKLVQNNISKAEKQAAKLAEGKGIVAKGKKLLFGSSATANDASRAAMAGVNVTDDAAKTAASFVDDGAKAAASFADDGAVTLANSGIIGKGKDIAIKGYAKLTTNAAGDKTLLGKVISFIKNFFDDILGKFAASAPAGAVKAATSKTGSLVSKLIETVTKKWNALATKISELLGGRVSVAAVSAGMAEVVFATLGAIEGVSGTKKLFHTDKVDGKMRVISGLFGGLAGTTAGAVVNLCLELFSAVTGIDLLNSFAVALYNAWCALTGDKEAVQNLQKSQKEFEDKYLNYKQSTIEAAYNSQLASGLIDKNMSLEEFAAKVDSGEIRVDYDSFNDYNTKQHRSIGDNLLHGAGQAIKGVKKGWGEVFGKNTKTFTDEKTGTKYVQNEDGSYNALDSKGNYITYKDANGKEVRATYSGKDLKQRGFTEGKDHVDSQFGLIRGIQGIGKGIGDGIGKGFAALADVTKNTAEFVTKGDIKGLWEYKVSDDESGVGSTLNALTLIPKIGLTGPTLLSSLGHGLVDGAGYVISHAKEGFEKLLSIGKDTTKLVGSGDIVGLWKYNPVDDDGGLGSLVNGLSIIPKIGLTGPTLLSGYYKTIVNTVKGFGKGVIDTFNKGKKAVEAVKNSKDKLAELSNKGDISGIWNVNIKADDDSPLGIIGNAITGLGKIFYSAIALFNMVFNPIKETLGKAGKIVDDVIEKAEDVPILGGIIKGVKSLVKGSDEGGNGLGGKGGNGSTYYSQNDPRWKNAAYNVGNDNATMGDTGCGPTALSMAISDATGKKVNPTRMAGLAELTGDRDDTGTNWNFVNKASRVAGVNSQQVISPTAGYIDAQVSSGHPVVLSGKTGGYGMSGSRSAFTNEGHYVYVSGKDNNGNWIINDPRGPQYSGAYNPLQVASETGSAWSLGGNGTRRGGRGTQYLQPAYQNQTLVAYDAKSMANWAPSYQQGGSTNTYTNGVLSATNGSRNDYNDLRPSYMTVGGKQATQISTTTATAATNNDFELPSAGAAKAMDAASNMSGYRGGSQSSGKWIIGEGGKITRQDTEKNSAESAYDAVLKNGFTEIICENGSIFIPGPDFDSISNSREGRLELIMHSDKTGHHYKVKLARYEFTKKFNLTLVRCKNGYLGLSNKYYKWAKSNLNHNGDSLSSMWMSWTIEDFTKEISKKFNLKSTDSSKSGSGSSESGTGEGGLVAEAGGSGNGGRWMEMVATSKQAMASQIGVYNQGLFKDVIVNGTTYHTRADCSGFVSLCLQVAGIYAPKRADSSANFGNSNDTLTNAGFTKMNFTSWDSLNPGDILCNPGSHVCIFSRNDGASHYVYNYGSNKSAANPGETTDNHSGYSVVWRPSAALTEGSWNGSQSADAASKDGKGNAKVEKESLWSKLTGGISRFISAFIDRALSGDWNTNYDDVFYPKEESEEGSESSGSSSGSNGSSSGGSASGGEYTSDSQLRKIGNIDEAYKVLDELNLGAKKTNFIKEILPGALQSKTDDKVRPSITLAQGALESGWGTSGLATKYKNLFGIKAGSSWTGPTADMLTREVVGGKSQTQNASWRVYPTWSDSVLDHGKLFHKDRYQPTVNATSWQDAAQKLGVSGYATDPNYGSSIHNMIESNKLYSWDNFDPSYEGKDNGSGYRGGSQSSGKWQVDENGKVTRVDPSGGNGGFGKGVKRGGRGWFDNLRNSIMASGSRDWGINPSDYDTSHTEKYNVSFNKVPQTPDTSSAAVDSVSGYRGGSQTSGKWIIDPKSGRVYKANTDNLSGYRGGSQSSGKWSIGEDGLVTRTDEKSSISNNTGINSDATKSSYSSASQIGNANMTDAAKLDKIIELLTSIATSSASSDQKLNALGSLEGLSSNVTNIIGAGGGGDKLTINSGRSVDGVDERRSDANFQIASKIATGGLY